MLNIIKSDLFRILRGKAIYIIFIVIILMNILSIVSMTTPNIGISIGNSGIVDINDTELLQRLSEAKSIGEYRDIMKSQGNYELDKAIIGQNSNLYYFFIAVVVVVLCADFSNKSIKNTLSSAISKRKYYFSKLILIMGIGTVIVLFNNYFSYFLNIAVNGENFASSLTDFTKLTFMQLPLLYGAISLLLCFAFVFRKTSAFNTISIPFIMVVQLIGMAIIILFKLKGDFFNYEIQMALSNLASNPSSDYILKCILLGVAYIIVFNVIGYYAFKKSEIK